MPADADAEVERQEPEPGSEEAPRFQFPPGFEPAPAKPATEEPTFSDETDIRSWIEGIPAQAMEQETPPAEEDDIPDWLRTPASPVAEGQAVQGSPAELAGPGEVSSSARELKPPDTAERVSAPVEREPVQSGGPLSGLKGVLPLAASVAEPQLAAKRTAPGGRESGAHIFEAILAEPVVEPEPVPAEQGTRRSTIRSLIYLALALAVVVPFLVPTNLAGSTLSISNTPAAEFYDILQGLAPNSTVLLAFDYDPSTASEMDLQANAIARDLVQRRIKIIAVSTLETGPQIAQRVLNKATANARDYGYGTHYINLGYLAGHEAGLAQLAATGLPLNNRDFLQNRTAGAFPILTGSGSLRDLPLVIELAGSEDVLRIWMEQVQARAGIKIAAGVSAGVEPRARAYHDARQLVALMSGLVGAARYEILSNAPGLAVTSVNAQSAAHIVLVLIVVLGNIGYWISRARGKAT